MNIELSYHDVLIIKNNKEYEGANTLERCIYNPLFGGRTVIFDMQTGRFESIENYFKDNQNSTISKIKVFFRSLGKLLKGILFFPLSIKRLIYRNIGTEKVEQDIANRTKKVVDEINKIS